MYLARATLKMRGGIDLPPATGLMGLKVNFFWTEMYERERQERLGLLHYVPSLLYLMAGVTPSFELAKRQEFLRPLTADMEGLITHDAYRTDHKRKRLHTKLRALKEEAAYIARVEGMSEDDSFVDKWLNWAI